MSEVTGWALWERYFERVEGPDWRNLRHGHSGMCAYCSGRITTELSQEFSARSKQYGNPTCATEQNEAASE